MVILQNISRRQLTLLLDHASFQDEATTEKGEAPAFRHKRIQRTTVSHSRKGQLTAVQRSVLIPDSLTILAGEKTKLLPDAVLQCRDTKVAIQKRELRIVSQPKAADKESKS